MKKRIAALLSVLLCVFLLGACGNAKTITMNPELVAQSEEAAKAAVEKISALDGDALAGEMELFSPDGLTPDNGYYSGLQSWENSKADLGALKSVGETSVKYDTTNKAYITYVETEYEQRTANVIVAINKDGSYASISFNPNYTMGERMAKAGMNTLMGIGIVFVMLALISLIIYCFKFIHEAEERSKKASQPKAAPAPAPAAPAAPEPEEEELVDDTELVAVIAAAIAAYEGTSPDGLVVRSIKRAGKNNWKRG